MKDEKERERESNGKCAIALPEASKEQFSRISTVSRFRSENL